MGLMLVLLLRVRGILRGRVELLMLISRGHGDVYEVVRG